MKKFIFILAITCAFAFVSCNGAKEEAPKTDSVVVQEQVAPVEVVAPVTDTVEVEVKVEKVK